MSKVSRNFVAGRMNKSVDERMLPEGEYMDAMNVRMGSTEKSEIGVIENTKGNVPLTQLSALGFQLSTTARTIGSIQDSANNLIYWFVHDPNYPSPSGKCDMIVSYNILTNVVTYHVISTYDQYGSGNTTVLNFNSDYLITGVNIIGELLFFTDYYNPPRVINVKRNYPVPNGVYYDQINQEQLLVIKKPPTQSPTVQPFSASGQENYLDTRFISFAYRYRYIDGEYSATSQWSDISFIPKPFEFSISSMLNEGMENSCNSAKVTYNSGGPLVVGIDLLFKQSANNIIKIIEKIDKSEAGLSNNTDYQFTFDSSKIFTILPESELLRLYDNVPLKAKAQTIMGNRLMYANYIEGYDLIDKNGNPVKFEYYTKLISDDIGLINLTDTTGVGNYSINGTQSIVDSVSYIDFSGVNLVEGAGINITFSFEHAYFSGGTPPSATTQEITFEFTFILPTSYSSVYQMATSPEFQGAVGTSLPIGNIKPVYTPISGGLTSCDGTTFTDSFNCSIPNQLGSLYKDASGISTAGQAIGILVTPSSTQIGFQFPAMKFVDNHTSPTNTVYEYYHFNSVIASFQEVASPKSLHSNRDYEIGIVYMDEFGRSSTALVSKNNTEHVQCAYSAKQNSIQVTIPPTQIAPYWASRYKFVIKPSAEFYETVYSQIFFTDPNTNEVWFFLEGENANKIQTGDRLIVKSDSSGPTQTCVYATVLEKAVKDANFITPASGIEVLGGVYMKINPNNFNAVEDANAIVTWGTLSTYAPAGTWGSGGNYSKLVYPVNVYKGAGFDPLNPTWEYEDFTIPAGSKIHIKADWDRAGKGADKKCDPRGYILDKTYTASNNYDSFIDWFNNDNVALTLGSGSAKYGSCTTAAYIPTIAPLATFDQCICYLQFNHNSTTNETTLQFGTGLSCEKWALHNKDWMNYYVTVTITVFRASGNMVFETEPTDALPDVFYENNLSFAIDSNGQHMGNVQNQTSTASAIIDTGFFNCFSFGNGVESYKIRDSIIGRYFNIGERVTTVSEQNYKMADRFADITYSGIYNPETNVNKLNEFNFGLLNYKRLEVSFGAAYILDGRETDVLVLQEDKISYVLAGKNLLSDSAAGGAITSVPEVLGTQIARVEKYGISFNPESYVHWGYNRYFTDVKRGVVINIMGDSMQQDRLSIISELGMRTWFRDEFNKSFNTQKLGGYDPYMNEYVLSTNNIKIPTKTECIPCGTTQTLSFDKPDESSAIYSFCVNVGQYIGDITIEWLDYITSVLGSEITITATYNSYGQVEAISSSSGSFVISKDIITEQTVYIDIEYSEAFSISLNVGCPDAELINIIQVVLANNSDSGDTTHIEYRYDFSTYSSPLQSSPVTLISGTTPPIVSYYNVISGYNGASNIPPGGSTVTIQSNQISPDSFVFNNANDKFRWLKTNVLYPNTHTGISALLAASNLATPITGSGTTYNADFVLSGTGNYIYLIWDFRDAMPMNLCYTPSSTSSPQKEVCCNCVSCGRTSCVTVKVQNPGSTSASIIFPNGDDLCGGTSSSLEVTIDPMTEATYCINYYESTELWIVTSGTPVITVTNCGCGSPPVNTVPPTLSFSSLYPGNDISVSNGTWT